MSTTTHPRTTAGPATLVLAGVAALALEAGAGSTDDALAALGWLVGWTLLLGAAAVGVTGVVGLVRRGDPTRDEVALLAVGVVVLVAVVAAHPLWGSGSGTA